MKSGNWRSETKMVLSLQNAEPGIRESENQTQNGSQYVKGGHGIRQLENEERKWFSICKRGNLESGNWISEA